MHQKDIFLGQSLRPHPECYSLLGVVAKLVYSWKMCEAHKYIKGEGRGVVVRCGVPGYRWTLDGH